MSIGFGEPTRDATDADMFPAPPAAVHLEYAVVGWPDVDEHADMGAPGTPEAGATMVRLTLYRGKAQTERARPSAAQGHQVIGLVMGPLYVVPPKGTRVLVCWPGGDTTAPCIILGWVGATPFTQFSATRAVLDVGAGEDLVVKGKSVTVMDHGADAGRYACWLTVGPSPAGGAPGIACNDPTGSGFVISQGVVGIFATDNGSPPAAKSVLELKAAGFGLVANGSALIKCDAIGNLTLGCGKALALVGANCVIGTGTPMPAIVGVSSPGAPSTSVFIAQ